MVSAHVCLLTLLVYIVEQTYGYARIQLNISMVSSTGTTRFSACLSENGDKCKGNYRELKWTGFDITRRTDANRTFEIADKIEAPWQSMNPGGKMYLIFKSTAGGWTRYDVSNLTARDGTIRDIKFDSLRINFTLSCWPMMYGADCTKGCLGYKNDSKCDADGNLICLGNNFGSRCRKPLCLNDATYHDGVCLCQSGWTGRRCDQAVYDLPGNSMLPFALLVALLALLSLFTMTALFVAFRSVRRPRQASVADSMTSSHLLLSSGSSESSADSEEKMIE